MIMYVPEELKVNKFVDAKIPSNKSYFARVGKQALPSGAYTGDEPVNFDTDKVSSIAYEEQRIFDEMRANEAGENGK